MILDWKPTGARILTVMSHSVSTQTGKNNNTSATIKPSPNEEDSIILLSFIIVGSVFAIVLFITCLVCYYYSRSCPCRNSGNTNRKKNESERDELYQNSNTMKDRTMRASLETVVNRPLPQRPVELTESVGTPEVLEDDYLKPINSVFDRNREEIRNLPPAPPVFPRHLERMVLDGEGTYVPVIPDDEAPLLPPGPVHEQLCELREEDGYVVPNLIRETFPQQSLTETDNSKKTK